MNILDFLLFLRNKEDIYWDIDKRIKYEDCINKFIPRYFEAFPCKELVERKKGKRIIVSLTTIPSRIDKVWIPIECMMRQSCKPDKILLWLGKDEFRKVELPDRLKRLQKKGLEIRFCKDVGVHTKYYYVLKEFSGDYIITIDDDMYYDTYLVKRLMKTARKNPQCVCARWVWQLEWSFHNRMYDSSTFNSFIMKKTKKKTAHKLLALGVGGVLYPPDVFKNIDLNLESALQLSTKNDDIWLKAIEILNSIKVAKVDERFAPDVIVNDTQEVALSHQNVGSNNNAKYLQAVFDFYNLWNKLEK